MPELPLEIWRDRVENEIQSLTKLGALEPDSVVKGDGQVQLIIAIKALGFLKESMDLIPVKKHRVQLTIMRDFPYPGGVNFQWLSPIFHPNIHPAEYVSPNTGEPGTGYICLNVLKKWSRLSDMETTVKALQMLVENPNPDDPLNYDICLEATEFFKENPMEKIREQFDFDANANEDDDDDIIIID